MLFLASEKYPIKVEDCFGYVCRGVLRHHDFNITITIPIVLVIYSYPDNSSIKYISIYILESLTTIWG
jgi:hypothetical protein